jgi:hypothetical protein
MYNLRANAVSCGSLSATFPSHLPIVGATYNLYISSANAYKVACLFTSRRVCDAESSQLSPTPLLVPCEYTDLPR